MTSYLLINGTLIDGTGTEPQIGDLHIIDDRIVQMGRCEASADATVIDCTGLTITPGFIDSHTHSDLQVLDGHKEKLLQGVTSEVVGNCGFSAYPPARDPAELRSFANGIFCGDDHWGWSSTEAYLADIERSSTANVLSLVGHGSLRIAVAGSRQGALTESELASMESLLAEALDAGAAGFSTGLMYAPGSSAPSDELRRLCSVTARKGKIYTSHMRTYFSGLVDAVDEQIDLVRHSGGRFQVSHLQAVGAANWPLQRIALDHIEDARAKGIDIEFDCYPYVAGSTVLTQLLPQSALDGGVPTLLHRLADPAQRSRISAETEDGLHWRWSDIFLSGIATSADQSVIGRNLEQIAEARNARPIDVVCDLLLESQGDANMLCFNQSIENLKSSITHPYATIISDGFYVKGRPHPRLHGTFPTLLGEMVRERGWLSLTEAVHKVTGKPAARYAMRQRGTLAPGNFADITVFDANTVGSPATYEQPELSPVGIHHVFRNGAAINLSA